jgi:hypothetical protein
LNAVVEEMEAKVAEKISELRTKVLPCPNSFRNIKVNQE